MLAPERSFHTIYLEESAQEYPLSQRLLEKFKKANLIKINSYQEIFNRNRQDFIQQKNSPSLILAKKEDQFLYPGSYFTPSFGHKNFYYNAMALNCIYNCSYCYLQGMFNSAHLVIFVNEDDFYESAINKLHELDSLYLSISYDTDLLSMENLTGFNAKWLEICRKNQNLLIESRTKSVNFKAIEEETVADNFILAWTISPEEICKELEPGTPKTTARMDALKSALDKGWTCRLCIDPILAIKNWPDIYRNFIKQLSKTIPLDQLYDISLGTFRMNKEYFKKIQRIRPEDSLYQFPYQQVDSVISYQDKLKDQLCSFVTDELANHIAREKIIIT